MNFYENYVSEAVLETISPAAVVGGSSEERWRLSIVAECIAVVVTSRI